MKYRNLYNLALIVFMSIILFGCSKNSKQRAIGFSEEVVSEQSIIEENPIGDTLMGDKDVCIVKDGPEGNSSKKGDPCFAPAPGSNKANTASSDKANTEILDKYVALLEVDKAIKLGSSGTALVWIGLEDKVPGKDEDVMRNSTTMEISTGLYARVTLSADSCEILKENPVVIQIRPDESSVRFTITPKQKKRGDINVYANIEFFKDEACTDGTNIKKATKSLHVKVRAGYFGKLWGEVEDGFSKFVTALIALFFGALLFVIRKFVKEKTGYDEEEQKQIFNKKRIGMGGEEESEVETEVKEESEKEIEQVGDDGNEDIEQEPLPADD